MEKDPYFSVKNLDVERTQNYFLHLKNGQKCSKMRGFEGFLGDFEGFLFHMKHTPIVQLFHVKHMFFARKSPS